MSRRHRNAALLDRCQAADILCADIALTGQAFAAVLILGAGLGVEEATACATEPRDVVADGIATAFGLIGTGALKWLAADALERQRIVTGQVFAALLLAATGHEALLALLLLLLLSGGSVVKDRQASQRGHAAANRQAESPPGPRVKVSSIHGRPPILM